MNRDSREAAGAEDDRADIEASLAGDGEAFARLVRRYEGTIAAQMWRFTRDRNTLEELVQDVFIEAYNSLGGYKHKAPFLHWLRRIATRVGYRYWRVQDRERKRRSELTEARALEPSAIDAMEAREAAEYLYSLLARLKAKDRLVLTLMYFEELEVKEIAERTGWSLSLVKVRAHRARKRLREMIETEAEEGVT